MRAAQLFSKNLIWAIFFLFFSVAICQTEKNFLFGLLCDLSVLNMGVSSSVFLCTEVPI